MPEGILGQKVGMTAVFTEDGRQLPVTVIKTAGNQVVGKRTAEKDGYTALVLGFGEQQAKRLTRPERGFFAKRKLLVERDGKTWAKRFVREFRVDADTLAGYELGEIFAADRVLQTGYKVDVIATSKGRGFAGVMQRHNFAGSKASHGVHEYFRHGGAISANTYPARVFKNRKMPGQKGNKRTTIQNLAVVDFLADEGLLLIRGSVPGPNGGLVRVQRAVKSSR